jgi:sulfite reductase (NADPH) flavoprotein alpha-component
MLPEHAPFSPDLRRALDGLLGGLSPIQRVWLGGYLSAGDGLPTPGGASTAAPAAATKLTVLYGSESGNAEKLADLSAKEAKKRGFAPTVEDREPPHHHQHLG